jgi:hypothetical protein
MNGIFLSVEGEGDRDKLSARHVVFERSR